MAFSLLTALTGSCQIILLTNTVSELSGCSGLTWKMLCFLSSSKSCGWVQPSPFLTSVAGLEDFLGSPNPDCVWLPGCRVSLLRECLIIPTGMTNCNRKDQKRPFAKELSTRCYSRCLKVHTSCLAQQGQTLSPSALKLKIFLSSLDAGIKN